MAHGFPDCPRYEICSYSLPLIVLVSCEVADQQYRNVPVPFSLQLLVPFWPHVRHGDRDKPDHFFFVHAKPSLAHSLLLIAERGDSIVIRV